MQWFEFNQTPDRHQVLQDEVKASKGRRCVDLAARVAANRAGILVDADRTKSGQKFFRLL